jgi:mannose-6-phosphate isomerase-like protein (cupin superfamily)
MGNPGRVIRLAEVEAAIPGPPGPNSDSFVRRGTLEVKFSYPLSPNRQTPHTQDELYVVVRGEGFLSHDGERDAFGPGDLLFVPAGTEHRFEDFSENLAIWVVFYGPHGGEVSE